MDRENTEENFEENLFFPFREENEEDNKTILHRRVYRVFKLALTTWFRTLMGH